MKKVINHGMGLSNPNSSRTLDRTNPQDCDVRQRNLGFYNKPQNINDLAIGDAGSGVSRFRRAQFWSLWTQQSPGGINDLIFDNPIAIATSRSADTRPRFFHVSFYTVGIQTFVTSPEEGGVFTSDQIYSANNSNPSSSILKGRVQIHDESGSRFFDVNIHGSASFSVYAFGITTFILLPTVRIPLDNGDIIKFPAGAEITDLNRNDFFAPLEAFTDNTLATGRIISLFQNDTKLFDPITNNAVVPTGSAGFIPVPPGSQVVQLRNIGGVDPTLLNIFFAGAPVNIDTGNSLGRIPFVDSFNSNLIQVPNAPWIVVRNTTGTTARIAATFQSEI